VVPPYKFRCAGHRVSVPARGCLVCLMSFALFGTTGASSKVVPFGCLSSPSFPFHPRGRCAPQPSMLGYFSLSAPPNDQTPREPRPHRSRVRLFQQSSSVLSNMNISCTCLLRTSHSGELVESHSNNLCLYCAPLRSQHWFPAICHGCAPSVIAECRPDGR